MSNQPQDAWDRFAQAVVQPESPAYGDERERAVMTEASTFGMQVGTYLCFAGALLTAVFGSILAPIVLIIAGSVPSFGMIWYAKRRGVDAQALAARAPLASISVAMVIVMTLLVLTGAAVSYTFWQGTGLLPSLPVDEIGWSPYFGIGMAVGAIIGLIFAVLGLAKDRRRAAIPDEGDTPDED